MTKNRLTADHKSKCGSKGYSDLALGQRISKGSSLPQIYLAFDELQHSLSNFIDYNPELAEPEDLPFLKYLLQMTFAVNSFLFGAGQEDWCENYLFDSEAQIWMEDRIEWFKIESKKNLGKDEWSSEFIVPRGYINRLRLKVRAVEASFWSYRDLIRDRFVSSFESEIEKIDSLNLESSRLTHKLNHYLKVRDRFNHQGEFLNILSNYFFWMGFHQQTKVEDAQFEEWISKAPKWKDY